MTVSRTRPAVAVLPLATWLEPGSVSYLELAAGLECLHIRRNPAGECITLLGCLDGAVAFACRCSNCGRSDGSRPALVNPYSRDAYDDRRPMMAGWSVTRCSKVACYNDANGRECWTVRNHTGGPAAFELPDRETAERVARDGGRIAQSHRFSWC